MPKEPDTPVLRTEFLHAGLRRNVFCPGNGDTEPFAAAAACQQRAYCEPAPATCNPCRFAPPSGSRFQKPGFNLSLTLDFDGAALLK